CIKLLLKLVFSRRTSLEASTCRSTSQFCLRIFADKTYLSATLILTPNAPSVNIFPVFRDDPRDCFICVSYHRSRRSEVTRSRRMTTLPSSEFQRWHYATGRWNQGSQELASDLNKLWNIDGQCKKAVIFLLSAHDRKLYYSGEENTGLTVADFDTVVSEQHQQLSEGKFTTALTNILKQIGRSQNERTDTGNDASGHSDPRIPVDNGTTFTSFSFLLLIAIAVAILL
uniref:RPB6 homolog n=1 Tax=Parascaris univalens TaxID=6257 RepID=A0A915BNQ7_PARUN